YAFDLSKFFVSVIALISCGSTPFAIEARSSGTSISGSTPCPSLNQVPSGLYILNVGTVIEPPSINGGAPLMPINPPHVLAPLIDDQCFFIPLCIELSH